MRANDHITPGIRYLRRHEVDADRWNACVENSASPLIYGYSHYLDGMTGGQWDALVWQDYRAVMPLTWRSKAGIRYCYQPAFTQQTGIFSIQTIDAPPVEAFLRALDRHFRFAEICLNYSNEHPSLTRRANAILPLDRSYQQIAAGYKKDLVRNLKAADRASLEYVSEFDLQAALAAFRKEYASRLPAITEKDYRRFGLLCESLLTRGQLLIRAVLDREGRPLCSAILLKDTRRFYLLHSTTLPAGRDTEANHFLLDCFVREWADSPMILDFEGSDHPGIAYFYANFGSAAQPYFVYRHNRLPWPVRWLK